MKLIWAVEWGWQRMGVFPVSLPNVMDGAFLGKLQSFALTSNSPIDVFPLSVLTLICVVGSLSYSLDHSWV